jgi:hypothetical protein
MTSQAIVEHAHSLGGTISYFIAVSARATAYRPLSIRHQNFAMPASTSISCK